MNFSIERVVTASDAVWREPIDGQEGTLHVRYKIKPILRSEKNWLDLDVVRLATGSQDTLVYAQEEPFLSFSLRLDSDSQIAGIRQMPTIYVSWKNIRRCTALYDVAEPDVLRLTGLYIVYTDEDIKPDAIKMGNSEQADDDSLLKLAHLPRMFNYKKVVKALLLGRTDQGKNRPLKAEEMRTLLSDHSVNSTNTQGEV